LESVYLRDITDDDLPQRVAWVNDPNTGGHMNFKGTVTLETTKKWFETVKNNSQKYHKIIVDTESGKSIGIIGLSETDFENKSTNYYIAIGDLDFRSRGISKAVIEMLFDHVFNTLKLNRIYTCIDKDNRVSIGMHARVGFLTEGVLRQHLIKNGKYIDRMMVSILAEDYFELKK